MLIWRRLQTNDDCRRNGPSPATTAGHCRSRHGAGHELDWLPVPLWITVPVVSWAIVGNLLETTVALFTTARSWPRW